MPYFFTIFIQAENDTTKLFPTPETGKCFKKLSVRCESSLQWESRMLRAGVVPGGASHIHIIFHKVLFKVNLLWCKKQKSTKTKEIFNRISNVSRCLKDIYAYTRITLVRTWLKIISFKFCVHSVWVCWKEVDFFNAIVNIKKCPETRTICGDKLFTLFAPWSSGWKVQKGSQRRLLN